MKNIEKQKKQISAAWKQTYLLDRRQLDSQSKDLAKLFPFSLNIAPWNEKIGKMLAEVDSNQTKIAKESKTVFQKLNDINQSVSNIRETLKFYEQSHEFLVKVQTMSESTLQKMQVFKQKMGTTYEELAGEQDRIVAELQLYDRKVDCIINGGESLPEERQKQNKRENVRAIIEKKQAERVPPEEPESNSDLADQMKAKEAECESIDRDIAGLGRHLGWTEEDHADFLAIWQRGQPKNYFQIEEELTAYFKFYTEEQIRQHMNKHLKWRQLHQAKKETISQYKLLKEQKKNQELQLFAQREQTSQQLRAKEQARRRDDEEQKARKAQVESWRLQREEKKREEQMARLREEEYRRMEEINRRREHAERKKELLSEWKEEVNSKKQKYSSCSKRPSTAIDHETEARIREREEHLVQKKLEIVAARKKDEELLRQVTLLTMQKSQDLKDRKNVRYSHVNSKVEEKTTAVRQKQRNKFDGKDPKEANTFGGNLMMLGVRATPAWMKGV